MDGIREKFERAIKACTKPESRLAAAVSGGADSMCLLHLCLTSPQIKKENLAVVSVDHMIRGENSKRDLVFVGEYCAKNGVRFLPFSVDVPRIAAETGKSIETAARGARREIFKQLILDKTVVQILVGHHASDNVESILMHIFRGCGLRGLIGMHNGNGAWWLTRPLIDVSKREIDTYIKEKSIPFVTDETNADNRHTRNFLRNEVIPRIQTKYPGVEDAILRLSAEAWDAADRLDDILDYAGCERSGTDESRVEIAELERVPADARHYIRGIIPGNVDRKHVDLVTALAAAENGTGIDLPGGYRAVKEYQYIVVYKNIQDPNFDRSAEIPFQTGVTDFNGVEITVAKEFGAVKAKILRFDLNKIPASAVFRFRRDGDIFKPYGGGTKKLKEYLIDKKIPVRHRDGLVCVADGREVLLIVGVEISDKIKAEENSDVYKIVAYYKNW